jgi:hypothetical protein
VEADESAEEITQIARALAMGGTLTRADLLTVIGVLEDEAARRRRTHDTTQRTPDGKPI